MIETRREAAFTLPPSAVATGAAVVPAGAFVCGLRALVSASATSFARTTPH
ncbi:hypothetical protein [Nocardia asiatica]|uniref:hypothetical protein n=1 Tax=Nocardia asiatica TaxID=209252 RepID=UPI0024540C53|nr:hypothetical protein [Nocardia asiatica]